MGKKSILNYKKKTHNKLSIVKQNIKRVFYYIIYVGPHAIYACNNSCQNVKKKIINNFFFRFNEMCTLYLPITVNLSIRFTVRARRKSTRHR